jgi:ureidoacrylate peracid hydrolase
MMSTPVFEKDLTGLLVVDPCNDFISEGGILWPLIMEIAEAVNCVPNMLATLEAARAASI